MARFCSLFFVAVSSLRSSRLYVLWARCYGRRGFGAAGGGKSRRSWRPGWCFVWGVFFPFLPFLARGRFVPGRYTSHPTEGMLTGIDSVQTGRERRGDPSGDQSREERTIGPPRGALVPFSFLCFFCPVVFFPGGTGPFWGDTGRGGAHFPLGGAPRALPLDETGGGPLGRRWSGRFWRWLRVHQGRPSQPPGEPEGAGFFGVSRCQPRFGTLKGPFPVSWARGPTAGRALSSQPHWPILWLDRVAFRRRRWMAKPPLNGRASGAVGIGCARRP